MKALATRVGLPKKKDRGVDSKQLAFAGNKKNKTKNIIVAVSENNKEATTVATVERCSIDKKFLTLKQNLWKEGTTIKNR